MSLPTPIGLSLLVTMALAHPAGAADKLSMKTLGARLAAKPTGEEARALAEDIRAWFGKDRSGRDNVINGANPKVEGLETAWAIEAPGAKKAAVVTERRQDPAADPDRRYARSSPPRSRSPTGRHSAGRTVIDGTQVAAGRGRSKSTPTRPSSPRSPACPRAS